MNLSNNQRELFRSCEILFGADLHLSGEFLDYLEVDGVKSAFRRRAMETHPDRQNGKDPWLQQESTALFSTVREAYENLLDFLQQKDTIQVSPKSRRTSTATTTKQKQGSSSRQPIKPIILPDEISSKGGFSNTETYYQGSLPGRRLLFGHFLYYSGLANWRTITRVLIWQKTERPRLGELALRFGIFDQNAINTIMSYKKPFYPFGQTARSLGLLSEQQLRTLIFQQQRLQKKFGTILLEKNLLKDYELRELLYQFERHNDNIFTRGRQ
jgi:DnaJ domain